MDFLTLFSLENAVDLTCFVQIAIPMFLLYVVGSAERRKLTASIEELKEMLEKKQQEKNPEN